MRRAFTAALPALALIAALATPATGDDLKPTDRRNKSVTSWIDDLGSTSYARRQRALGALRALGAEAAPHLRSALKAKPALETRSRIERLLGQPAAGTTGRAPARQNVAKAEKLEVVAPGPSLRCLMYLDRVQQATGVWRGDQPDSDALVTSVATLAFLGAGHTHRYGRYKQTVKAAMKYFLEQQDKDGRFTTEGPVVLTQAWASLALAEAYGMTKSPLLRVRARRAVVALIAMQNARTAWSHHRRDGHPDIDPTHIAMMALKSAKAGSLGAAGVETALKRLEWRYLKGPRPTDPTDLAGHLVGAVFLGVKRGDKRFRAGIAALAKHPPRARGDDQTRVWLSTLAAFQDGRGTWKAWNKRLKPAVMDNQVAGKGKLAGSWAPSGAQSSLWGRTYATALSAMSLQIYYIRQRLFQ